MINLILTNKAWKIAKLGFIRLLYDQGDDTENDTENDKTSGEFHYQHRTTATVQILRPRPLEQTLCKSVTGILKGLHVK